MSRVYIGRLSYRAREKDVERFFKGYGKILEVDLKNGYGEIYSLFAAVGVSVCRPRRHVKQRLGPCRVLPLRPALAIVVSFLFGFLFFTRFVLISFVKLQKRRGCVENALFCIGRWFN